MKSIAQHFSCSFWLIKGSFHVLPFVFVQIEWFEKKQDCARKMDFTIGLVWLIFDCFISFSNKSKYQYYEK